MAVLPAVATLAALAAVPLGAETLLTEGFNDTALPAGWATEIVTPSSPPPALGFLASSVNPPGFSPVEGARFLRFNSRACPKTSAIRLTHTNGVPTMGMSDVTVSFWWTRDRGFS